MEMYRAIIATTVLNASTKGKVPFKNWRNNPYRTVKANTEIKRITVFLKDIFFL